MDETIIELQEISENLLSKINALEKRIKILEEKTITTNDIQRAIDKLQVKNE